MRLLKWVLIIFPLSCFSQQAQNANIGEVEGIVFDSLHNYVLRSATVAIYRADSSRPISYQFTNALGEFAFKGIPVEIPCKLVVSYVGYRSTIRAFIITKQQPSIDIGKLNILPGQKDLDEVVVSYTPPVRMNGDTLEFNPNAFKLGENAVVEDLLRKLPGVIVWGDGSITVNGREVKSVLVEGKPFFGGGTKVATQNIPKDAVDKIQVYQKTTNPQNEMDSTTEVNIKLKNNKNHGVFGKLSAGYGTRQRFDMDANLNFFTPKTQVSLVGAYNNVNKTASDLKTLLENSTYKGEGASIAYQPEFGRPGITRPLEAGFSLQHDFIPKIDNFNVNRLNADYLFNRVETAIVTNSRTTNALQTGDFLVIQSQNTNDLTSTRHQFNTRYEKKDLGQTFLIMPFFYNTNNQARIVSSSSSIDHSSNIQSRNENDNTSNATERVIGFSGQYDTRFRASRKWLRTTYSFSAGHTNTAQALRSLFNSDDPSKDRVIDRTYSNGRDYLASTLSVSLERFAAIRLNGVTLASFDAGIEASLNTDKQGNNVYDKDPASGNLLRNNYLSNPSNYSLLSVTPYIRIGRSFSKTLSNRYSRYTDIYVNLKEQITHQQNNVGHLFQQFDHTWFRFAPQAGIRHSNMRFSKFSDEFVAKISVTPDYADPGQLLTLIDSAQIYNMYSGNPNLQPFERREIVLSFSHMSFKKTAPLNYEIALKGGTVRNFIGDSAQIDKDGQTVHYPVNLNGYRYIGADASLRKSFNFNRQALQIMAKLNSTLSDRPNYLNQVYYVSRQWSNTAGVDLFYSLDRYLAVNVGQSFSYYWSRQLQISKNNFSSALNTTRVSISSGITEKLTLSSNISFNNNISTGAPTTSFTIWNASTSYRFLKKQNAEVKFSAFDLLRQNVNIINEGTNNSLTVRTNNALRQYFMLTLTYFPRKFGD